ncbi:MAG: DNA polymerase I [Anaerolineales bacterium]|nr:MAG: DNA polymerase I [Anaerolineales bacterium]
MTPRPRLFLIDGHALAYRTYFALSGVGGGSRWITKAGEPTAGTYGFTAVLLRLLEQEQPEYLAVSFDTGKTFRDELYPEYKATRDKMPDDLRLQIDRIHEVVSTFGIPILEADGFEADDVLGTVARRAAEQGVDVIILTGDRDLLQLADEHVTIRLAGQKLSEALDFGPDQVRERYILDPQQLIDQKALMGDSSDNIPGVSGIGEKTAVQLLQEYKTLDAIYLNLEEIPTRFRNKLEADRDNAYLSQTLGRIETNVPIEFDLEACRAAGYDRNGIIELFRVLEFRTLMDRIPGAEKTALAGQMSLFNTSADSSPVPEREVIVVNTTDALKQLGTRLMQAAHIAFDVETTGTDPMQAQLVGISLAIEAGQGYYLPIGHNPGIAGGKQLALTTIIETLREPLTNPGIPKVGHNLKYDYIVLARAGLHAAPLAFDTMVAEWLCDPGSHNLGLKNLAWVRLGIEMVEIQALIGSGKKQRSMADVPIEQVAPYAAADAEVCLRLLPELKQELSEKGHWDLFQDLEMPLVSILAHMEMAGIKLDTLFLDQLSQSMAKRLAEIETEIFRHAGHSFNINSTQQLSTVLFDELKLAAPDRTRKTASGHYSTAANVLEELGEHHPIIAQILEQREIAKLKSTYADSFPNQVHPQTHRVHTSYNQTGSVTGRLASSDPNLQNIPIRTELGREIRRAFIAEPDHILLSVDYSQIELRIVAHIAEDQAMIQAFLEDQDIHAATAAAIGNVKLEQVTPDMRRNAKAINFGLIYGMSPYGLTRTTDLTLAEAENFVKAYFERFPGVQAYLEQIRSRVVQDGFVETLLGRKRYFPQLAQGSSTSEVIRSRALREAINAPIQGTAADIIKLAMLKLPERLQENGLSARMLLQVHDELVFECHQNELAATVGLVQQIMQAAYVLKVPLKTDAKAGENWADMTAM